MHIDSHFSLANSSVEEADYVIYGIPYDSTQSYRCGSRFAPAAIRQASWNLESYSVYFSFDLSGVRFCDAGNVNCDGSFDKIARRVEEFVYGIKAFPIALGGEHTVSYAASKKFRDATFLSLDAHFDLRDVFDDSKLSHACVVRRIYEEGSNVVIAGVRSGSVEDVEFAKRNGIPFFPPWKFEIEEIVKELGDEVYLSVDMDFFDPSFAPGVSSPEPFGLTPLHFLKLLERIADRIVALDVVEVIPDENHVTQTLAAKLVFEAVAARETKI
ncbi:MAG: agmatinase [Archaeoglobaceae archaeon]